MRNIQKIFIIIFFTLVTQFTFADPCNQNDVDYDPDACSAIPIDGGVSLLIAAGVAYGGKKIADNRKAKKELKQGE